MNLRQPIQRGDIVRKSFGRMDFYGNAQTTEGRASRLKVRVEWYPDFGTWEEPEDLTVVHYLDRAK